VRQKNTSMDIEPTVKFDDTSVAFSYKSDRELKKANFIFSLINHPFISSVATNAVQLGLALHLPIKGLIKNTVFDHFCGGENITESEKTVANLSRFHVGAILDYSVEGAETEEGFDSTLREILLTFDKAKGNPSIPFCVFKVTGLGLMDTLEKVQSKKTLTNEEEAELERVKNRFALICKKAYDTQVPVLVDAEDSWIQDVIDTMAYDMMLKYNKEKAIVFNTFQMYRSDMLNNLKDAFHKATMNNYYLGVKMVRGAYMEKEAERAAKKGYSNPIHATKEATDESFNKGLAFCVDNKQRITFMCGSHNEYSNLYLTVLMEKHGMKPNDERVWFGQLLGMSDNISFNLAKAGYNVAKYVPYGPVDAVMPYLIRRAAENTSVAGQSSRELTMIRKELARRKN
jgi:proline dehydrogenase